MYKIMKVCDALNPRYKVLDADCNILCVFEKLNVAADFVAYIQGVALDEDDKYFVDEAIKKFHKATKQGGFNGAKIHG